MHAHIIGPAGTADHLSYQDHCVSAFVLGPKPDDSKQAQRRNYHTRAAHPISPHCTHVDWEEKGYTRSPASGPRRRDRSGSGKCVVVQRGTTHTEQTSAAPLSLGSTLSPCSKR